MAARSGQRAWHESISSKLNRKSQGDPRVREHALALLRDALADPAAQFRDGQWEAIHRLTNDRARLLVVQRTGWGKSLVYFLTTRLLRDEGAGPTLLISPLLALMRNQIEAATRLGLRAATMNSSNTEDWEEVRARLREDAVDILLVSPERLANDDFRDNVLLPMVARVGFFVVDEAHCISDWGHDFRPDYRRIVRVLQLLPASVPLLATTATANDRVVADVVETLGRGTQVVRGPLARSGLLLQNIMLPGAAARLAWLAEQLPALPGSGIVYTLTIGDAQRVAEWLRSRGIDAHAYWGGQEAATRADLEARLIENRVKVLVATTALGMGFDKPDLGFVIHYQRPGSVVHYYQQVGRAGRAVERSYGVLLGGREDHEIVDYFISTAFPPEGHVDQVLGALRTADDGMSLPMLERHVNLRRGQIEKVLKHLAVMVPAPASKQEGRWYANPVRYQPDREKVQQLTAIRRLEQKRMAEYMQSRECLMRFLARELDDPHPRACGQCAVCRGAPLLPVRSSQEMVERATAFLRGNDQRIEPRRMWPPDAFAQYGWRGRIRGDLCHQPGRSLCTWGDDGWGDLVRRGKQGGIFAGSLVAACATMIRERWRPDPAPQWVTCVPSLKHPDLVPDFARRLAEAIDLPFVECVRKIHDTPPQKEMENSYRQAHNLDGSFAVIPWPGMASPVLLVDDMIDSGWTFAVVSALLREQGSGDVFPVALAVTTGGA